MVQNGPKCTNMFQNRSTWSNIFQNGSYLVQNGPKWSKMVQNGITWSNMVQFLSTKSSKWVLHNLVSWSGLFSFFFLPSLDFLINVYQWILEHREYLHQRKKVSLGRRVPFSHRCTNGFQINFVLYFSSSNFTQFCIFFYSQLFD